MEELRDGDPIRLGPYRLRGRLGEGGMGEVFLGTSPSGVRVAVKTVRPEFATDHGFRDRFRREIDLARRVDSAWTAPIAEADPDARPPWLATEFLTGLSLSEAINRYGPLPEGTLRILGAQLAEALMAIHRAGLIHRDLKPSNVVLGRDRLRVIDFGVSRAVDEGGQGLTGTGRVVGSPAFMSPEQAGGRALGPASDVFSLGSVLVFAATGRGPFHHDAPVPQLQMMMRVLRDEPALTDVPDGIRDLLAECLDKDPDRRPTPTAVLNRFMGDDEPPATTSWLPAALAAELERRHLGDPTAPAALSPVEPTGEVTVPPTRALGIGVENGASAGQTRAAESAPPAGRKTPPPQPSLPPTVGMPEPPPEKRALTRRAFLFGGGSLAVAAVGGGAGWLLMGDESDPGKRVWQYAAGAVAASSLKVQGDLVYHVADGVGGAKGQITAIDAESGKQVWRKATAGSSVSAPLTAKDHVFVVSWTVDGSASVAEKTQPSICTVHAFALGDGEQRWSQEYAARWVNLPAALDGDVLYLGVSEENSTSPDAGRIVAIDVTRNKEVWKAEMTGDAGMPSTPVFTGSMVYVFAQPRYSSYPSVIRAYERNGTPKWEIPFKDCPWGRDVVVAGERVLTVVTSGSSGGVYTWQRHARYAATGAPAWGPISVKGGQSRGFTLAGDIAYFAYDGADDTSRSGLVAVDPVTGAEMWKYEMEARNVGEVTRVGDVVYVANHPSKAQAGVKPSSTASAPPTDEPPTSVTRSKVYALNARTGVVVWSRELPSFGAPGTPVVQNGKVYVSMDATAADATGDDAAQLFALRVKTGEPAWKVVLPAPVSSRVVLAKGNAYLGQWQPSNSARPAASVVAYEA